MRHISLILIAMAALLLGACQTDDATPSVSEEPLFPSASAGASVAASTDASADASVSESADASASPESSASPDDDDDDASASPDESDDAGASPDESDDATGGTGGTGDDACDEAFADVPELTTIDSLTALQDVFAAVDETIEACDSADQWTELAADELALVDSPEDAEQFLRARCDESDEIEDSDICEEL